jgi:hypothetical protein
VFGLYLVPAVKKMGQLAVDLAGCIDGTKLARYQQAAISGLIPCDAVAVSHQIIGPRPAAVVLCRADPRELRALRIAMACVPNTLKGDHEWKYLPL